MPEVSDDDIHPAYRLASHVIEARNGHRWFQVVRDQGLLVSDNAIRRVVRLAYDASLMSEEGRFPRFRIAWIQMPPLICFGDSGSLRSISINNADVLRRLAPIVTRPNSAIAIQFTAMDEINCVGVCEFSDAIDQYRRTDTSNAWEIGETLSQSVLAVYIEGPGCIRAGFLPAQSFVLRGSEIRRISSWIHTAAIAPFENLSHLIVKQVRQISHPLGKEVLFTSGQSENFVVELWSHILRLVSAGRHGGAFIICVEEAAHGVVSGYTADLDLCTELLKCIEESLTSAAGNTIEAFRHAWHIRRPMLFNAAEQIAGLAAVDGCVVMDPQLKLKSFGTKLRSKEIHELPPALKGVGMRHSSAYNFCAENKAVAFVVSQDGQLTVIASPKGNVEVHCDVHPGVQWSQD